MTNRVYAVYAISSLDTGSSLRRDTYAWGVVGTHQGVAGLTPRPFTLEEEAGCAAAVAAVYAVYAISSLDTGSPLRHRTCNGTVYAVYAISSLDTG